MSFSVPTIDEPFYTSRVRLDDRDYTLEFWYATRTDRYYLNLFDAEEVPLVCGLKLVCNVPLLKYQHHKDAVPAGELIVVCSTPDATPPKLGEIGAGLRCELTYFTRAELEAVEA